MGGEGAEAGIFYACFACKVGDVDKSGGIKRGTCTEVFDVITHRHAHFGLAGVAEYREGEGNPATLIQAENKNMMLAGELQDGRQVILAGGVRRLRFGSKPKTRSWANCSMARWASFIVSMTSLGPVHSPTGKVSIKSFSIRIPPLTGGGVASGCAGGSSTAI